MNNKRMEYDEMMFLAKMKRKAKIEFENNLWKQRFEELNGFPMKEGLGKENIIMPFSENDYLDKSPIKFDEGKQQIELIRKVVEEKLKNYHLVSDYKEQLTYLFEQIKDYNLCQEIPLIDVTRDKEKGTIYINLYRTDFSKNDE